MNNLVSTLIQALHQFAKNNQFQRAVIGLSGGLDSAFALSIAIRAFGAQNVTALVLPEIGLTPHDDIDRARLLTQYFGCQSHYQPINNFLVDYNFVSWDKSETANEQLKAKIRGSLIEHFSEAHNAMIVGSANKSDLSLGLGTINGEFIGALHVLGDLYKTDVMDLTVLLGLPAELAQEGFSRHLKPNQTDLEDLGGSWTKIDDILRQLEDQIDPQTMIEKGMDALLVHKVVRMVQQNAAQQKFYNVIRVGRVTESIKKACAAEAESI